MDYNDIVGNIVFSKAGRDKGKFFIIVGIVDENYVYISNGCLRKIDKPKKKKLRHLKFVGVVEEEIKRSVLLGEKVSDLKIKSALESYDTNKEV